MKVAVDDDEFHSGKHSFRLEPVKNGFNRLVFNAVPYQIGKPLVFSMYLKAEKPKTAVSLGFFTHHGAAYLRTVSVGTEWKKYELAVPSFGDSAPGVIKIGNPAMTESFHHVSPIVTPAGKVWLDDAACQPALKSTEIPPPAIALSGKLESEHGYFYAGKPFRGTIQLDAAAGAKSCRLNWELRNWRGEVVAAGKTPESIAVPGKKPFSITPPANVLGPVNLIFTATAEDGKAYTFYTGILRSPGKSLTRWGTNVHTSPQDDAFTIRLFRDFGLGAVRLWAKPNEPECGGFRSATRFHDAGFLVMVNISGHTPQAPFYIPKDARSLITGHPTPRQGGLLRALQRTGDLGRQNDQSRSREVQPLHAGELRRRHRADGAGNPRTGSAGENRRSRVPRETGISGGVSEGGCGESAGRPYRTPLPPAPGAARSGNRPAGISGGAETLPPRPPDPQLRKRQHELPDAAGQPDSPPRRSVRGA